MAYRKSLARSLFCIVVTILVAGWTGQVYSQETYPTKPIEIIVPYPPGGGTDLAARIIATYLAKKWGVPVNAVNKPGGNTVPGCMEVHRAVPNGYTLLADGLGTASMLGIVVKSLPFKIMDRTFIATTNVYPVVAIVSPNSPYKTFGDLVADLKSDSENFTWTSGGGTGVQDFMARQLFKGTGVDIRKTKAVLTQAGTEPVVLTAGGRVKLGMGSTSITMPAISGGTVRALAITSKGRYPALQDVPTTTELGFPTVTAQLWNGISGPPNLPAQITEKWQKALEEMLNDSEVVSKLKNAGAIPFYHGSREAKEYILKETEEAERLWAM
jgi:tripartite-type tricarboxylate transporter receptor subunit TctC